MIAYMAKRKTKKRDGGNLNPQFPVRLPLAMREAVDAQAEIDAQTSTELVRAALREYLSVRGKWPPPPPRDAASTQQKDS